MQPPKVCGDPQDVHKAPACYLLHPAGKTLSVGQLVVVSVPAALGAPVAHLQLSEEHSAAGAAVLSDLAAIPAVAGTEQAEQTFVACWQAEWPMLSEARLQVTINGQLHEVYSQLERTEAAQWNSCG